MNLRHVALVCSSEENADRFFGRVLGLNKAEPKTLPRALSLALFDIDRDLAVINYTGDGAHFEIFIAGRAPRRAQPIEHVCLDVPDLPAFLARCRDAGMTVIQVPKGDSVLTFIRDADDNLFEIKEQKNG
jgi:catechol 2,3-dioxygenase-like lactoylglutathione lyase family enzyme